MSIAFNREQGLKSLTLMIRSRLFEKKIEALFSSHEMHGTTHLAIGQEAVHAGVSPALDPEDWILTTHRCHGHTLAKGASVEAMLSEFFGLSQGLSKGLGGSMHLVDLEHHNGGTSAVVGSGVAIATGMALQLKRTGSHNLVVAFFGDGASSRGIIHEAMNMASIWNLPVLFLCEHNLYGMSSCATNMVSVESIASRGASYSIESRTVDGNDVEVVYAAVQEAAQYIREESRPYLLETRTYRLSGHSKNDMRNYRTREEEAAWIQRDPLKILKERMIARGHLSEDDYNLLEKHEQKSLDKIAESLAKQKRYLSFEEASSYVYATGGSR
ncbi:MAG: thiamine pyrophosphate-dependent dehydrogenase E1 component subunit alpha [Sphaerochaetaceae bacterium]|jgi:TPP-dependent pyruvate/acetoin dehydrogenase alpha subunit|nr:thiamine pyrophosphate-dependent dehydrogenase E1 component subunit alpha [Sphaerochaetaceae bacterium]